MENQQINKAANQQINKSTNQQIDNKPFRKHSIVLQYSRLPKIGRWIGVVVDYIFDTWGSRATNYRNLQQHHIFRTHTLLHITQTQSYYIESCIFTQPLEDEIISKCAHQFPGYLWVDGRMDGLVANSKSLSVCTLFLPWCRASSPLTRRSASSLFLPCVYLCLCLCLCECGYRIVTHLEKCFKKTGPTGGWTLVMLPINIVSKGSSELRARAV